MPFNIVIDCHLSDSTLFLAIRFSGLYFLLIILASQEFIINILSDNFNSVFCKSIDTCVKSFLINISDLVYKMYTTLC